MRLRLRPLSLSSVVTLCLWALFVSVASPCEAQESDAGDPSAKAVVAGDAKKEDAAKGKTDKPKTPWRSLKEHWVACEFGGEGDASIKDGVVTLEYGDPLTGVHWDGPFEGDKEATKEKDVAPLPRDNYELRWECIRDDGFDFLCAFTFPVEQANVSLVMGGWGGGITGISSIDGQDASDNQTTMFKAFENDRWYKARVRVEKAKITVWLDGTLMFEQPRADHKFDIRFEMDPCTPLGIANFECDSRIKNIQIRKLHPSELADVETEE